MAAHHTHHLNYDERRGGNSILTMYNNSISKMLYTVYPQHDWKLFLFEKVQTGFWNDPKNHKVYFDWLEKELNITTKDDWYKMSVNDVVRVSGSAMLSNFYGNSLVKALQTVYPQHKWQLWRFVAVPYRVWSDSNHHREFFDWFAHQKGMRTKEEWYDVQPMQINSMGGERVLECYGGNMGKALAAVYKEHPWELWRFGNIPHGYWDDTSTHKLYFDWLGNKMGVNQLDDWYRVKVWGG